MKKYFNTTYNLLYTVKSNKYASLSSLLKMGLLAVWTPSSENCLKGCSSEIDGNFGNNLSVVSLLLEAESSNLVLITYC